MNKSRVESAVQELPARSGRSRTDVSSMRSLDNLVLPADQVESDSSDEEFDEALSFLDPQEPGQVEGSEEAVEILVPEAQPETELEFDPLEADDEIHIEDLDPEEEAEEASHDGSAAVAELLRVLEEPLAEAYADAERILGDPDRVAKWLENQARRRLLALATRLSDELRDTEMKRALSSPPPAD